MIVYFVTRRVSPRILKRKQAVLRTGRLPQQLRQLLGRQRRRRLPLLLSRHSLPLQPPRRVHRSISSSSRNSSSSNKHNSSSSVEEGWRGSVPVAYSALVVEVPPEDTRPTISSRRSVRWCQRTRRSCSR